MGELVAGLTSADLRALTNEMVDAMLARIADCVDADVPFVPDDPQAYDGNAANPEDVYLAWTLGHVICHTTGTSDQDAANAAELARGNAFPNEPRNEVPWESVTTIAHCRQRLEESRRHRLAKIDLWPAEIADDARLRALKRFAHGLSHDDAHLPHLAEIVRQAKAARGAT